MWRLVHDVRQAGQGDFAVSARLPSSTARPDCPIAVSSGQAGSGTERQHRSMCETLGNWALQPHPPPTFGSRTSIDSNVSYRWEV
jgi:hypothetical protein